MKRYIKPTMEVVNVATEAMICDSPLGVKSTNQEITTDSKERSSIFDNSDSRYNRSLW